MYKERQRERKRERELVSASGFGDDVVHGIEGSLHLDGRLLDGPLGLIGRIRREAFSNVAVAGSDCARRSFVTVGMPLSKDRRLAWCANSRFILLRWMTSSA